MGLWLDRAGRGGRDKANESPRGHPIGENALRPAALGGGSSRVRPHYAASLLDGLLQRAAGNAQIAFEIGCATHRRVPLIAPACMRSADGVQGGLTVEAYANPDLQGDAVLTYVTDQSELEWPRFSVPGVEGSDFSVRMAGFLTVAEPGKYQFGLTSTGECRLSIGGQWLLLGREGDQGIEQFAEVELEPGLAYRLVVECRFLHECHWHGLRLGCAQAIPADAMDAAVALAARSDVAIVVAGLTDEWESEGFDRSDMDLPGKQAQLIEAVAAANANTIVILNAGSPVTMSWLDCVAAVLVAWYPGQEGGNAMADLLLGNANPSGKLPQTFPVRLEDNPAFINYPGEGGQVLYGEGIWVGYRYYDKKEVAPLFCFGHGLSYTSFEYGELTLSAGTLAAGDSIDVRVDVRNSGLRQGSEVVQLYVRDTVSNYVRPEKELKAFCKLLLEPGETKSATFVLGPEAMSFCDPVQARWIVEPGEFEVLVGSSSHDIRARGRFWLAGE